jgi:hypothetical protein
MSGEFVKDYDVCPCWISPCNPDEHKGGCQDYEMGECRCPYEKREWILCSHLAIECNNRCDNIYCEKHKDYHKFKNCYNDGCFNEVTIVVNDNGVDIPLCDYHYEERELLRTQMESQIKKEQQDYKKKYTPLNIIEQWVGHHRSEIEDSSTRCKHIIGYTIDADEIEKLICDIRKDLDEVVKRGLKKGWLK